MNEEIEQLKLQLTGAHNANIALNKQINEMSLIIEISSIMKVGFTPNTTSKEYRNGQ